MALPPDAAVETATSEDPAAGLGVPPVVAVVVAHDAGPSLEACLASLRDQEYEALSVLVIDAGSAADPTPRVAQVLPSAFVRRLDANVGFGAAANDVLEVVEGAAFFLLCHDDVALAADAVRAMVEEAFRSNAGIVSPKLVDWDDPHVLVDVGATADKTGVPARLVEPGELDQEQHDAVRDVFFAPGGCTLVRADLFAALRGFDTAIDLLGEDLDLSWRAQVAGARVIVVPAAVVRHQRKLGERVPTEQFRPRQARHRLRTMLTCYSSWHLVRVVPQAAVLTVLEVLYALLSGHWQQARDVAGAWSWNLRRSSELRANRKALKALRQVPDSEVRRLQVRGSARLSAFVRGQIGGRSDDRIRSVTAAGRDLAGSLRAGRRADVIGWSVVVLVLLVGSRDLLTGHLPQLADLPAFPSRPWPLFGEWVSGWRRSGLGSTAPAPTAFALLGGAGTLLLGSMSALRRLLLLIPFVVGVAGAWRASRPLGGRQARIVLVLAFTAIPVPYDAVAAGRWGGLLLWSATPWVLRSLFSATEEAPFAAEAPRPRRRRVVGLGLLLAVVGAFEPVVVPASIVMALGLVLGGLVASGRRSGGLRVLGVALPAGLVAAILHVPWTLDLVLPGARWSAIGGVRSLGADLGIGELIRFNTDGRGGDIAGWAFLAAAALPLLIGRDWRLRWAVRAWVLALTCWSVAWAGQQPWWHLGTGTPEALLAPAALALSLAIALGLVAFQVDLPGYRFGWRQVASVLAAASLAVGAVPVLAASINGRWHLPDTGFESVLGFMQDDQAQGPFRVLWIGDPAVLPLRGWSLRDGLAYGTTDGGLPSVQDRWPAADEGSTGLLADAVRVADRQETARLGRLLAPLGVRYVVVAEASSPSGGDRRPVPADLLQALGGQLDLTEISLDPTVRVYRNAAWLPARAQVPLDAAASYTATAYFPAAAALDTAGATPALPEGHGPTRFTGPLPDRSFVYFAAADAPGWELTVDGRAAPRSTALGWANGFAVPQGGRAELTFRTPPARWLLLALQVVLWALAIRELRPRPQRRPAPAPEVGS